VEFDSSHWRDSSDPACSDVPTTRGLTASAPLRLKYYDKKAGCHNNNKDLQAGIVVLFRGSEVCVKLFSCCVELKRRSRPAATQCIHQNRTLCMLSKKGILTKAGVTSIHTTLLGAARYASINDFTRDASVGACSALGTFPIAA
jgi:hypothetical protein